MWIVFRVASILWFIYFVVFTSLVSSLSSRNTSVIILQLSFALLIILMGIAVFLFYYVSLKEKRRRINRKLRISLLAYFRKYEYVVPLVDFAEENNVKMRDAQRFIDMLIEHYNGKLDINEQGIIIYHSHFITKKSNKKNNGQAKKKGKKKKR